MKKIIWIVLTQFFTTYAYAITIGQSSYEETFPMTPHIRNQVRFWESIFKVYSTRDALIHDIDDPKNILDVVNISMLNKKYDSRLKERQLKSISQQFVDRYQKALYRFQTLGLKALDFGHIEKRVYQVFSKSKQSLNKLYSGKIKIRIQLGLADEFKKAAQRSQNYMPFMEEAFEKQGLPKDLTRLAFVESMFNVEAKSKYGATGIWQFMTSTAKKYMIVNPLVDERRSPYKSTRAAAKLLTENYQGLKSWPLAITAYNVGRQGVEKGLRAVKTQTLEDVILYYEEPSFKFAAKNFYAEFVAAKNVFRDLYASKNRLLSRDKVKSYRLKSSLSIEKILQKTKLSASLLKKYNYCLHPSLFTIHKDSPLPRNYELFLPQTLGENVATTFSGRNIL